MNTIAPASTGPEVSTSASPSTAPFEPDVATASADPVSAEEVGHPVGVGLGALGAGAAGAAIGAVGGPVGMLVGAVIGAVAGGLVGEEVAAAGDQAETDNPDATYTAPPVSEPASLENSRVAADPVPDLSGTRPPEFEADVYEFSSAPAFATPNGSSNGGYSEEAVRTSAYYRYLDRQMAGREGDELGDWIEAEREVQGA
jgi:hypothetical protein